MTRVGSGELERRRRVVERWRRSGQSAAEFGKSQGVSQWTLYSWARGRGSKGSNARRRDRRARKVELIPVRLLDHDEGDAASTPSSVVEGVIEIALSGGAVVRIVGDVPGERVRSVVAAVRQAC